MIPRRKGCSQRTDLIVALYYVQYTMNRSEWLEPQPLIHVYFHAIIQFLEAATLLSFSFLVLQFRPARPCSLFIPFTASVRFIYCRKMYFGPMLSVWIFRRRSSNNIAFQSTDSFSPFLATNKKPFAVLLLCPFLSLANTR